MISALINNFNMNCHKQYTKVSSLLGSKLDKELTEIERFYYTEFWEDRLFKKLYGYDTCEKLNIICRIQGATSYLKDEIKFKLYDEHPDKNGVSNNDDMIALNINMSELNDYHIKNVIMHEFGHRQYSLPEFKIITIINLETFGDIEKQIKDDSLSNIDYKYFTNHDELRQRIIPIIKEMYDNDWTLNETYELSTNLKNDDIKNIFKKEYILHLLKNIL